MDGQALLGSRDRKLVSLDVVGDALPSTMAADGVTRMGTGAVLGAAWLSCRPEYWPPRAAEEGLGARPGIACLLFGVGAGGAGWLARLACSAWFAGLEPRAEDIAAAGGIPAGSWAVPAAGTVADGGRVAAEAEAFFASAPLPRAWLAAVAVSRGAGPTERSAALGLVGTLRARRDPLGRRLSVVVTVEAATTRSVGGAAAGAFVRRLLDLGAFVVHGGGGPGTAAAGGDHLHHFPLRAAVMPRRGRLICTDLADHLYTWRPGRVGDLHVVPFARGDADRALRGLAPPLAGGGARALDLGFHLDPGEPGMTLAGIDRFAIRCCELLLASDGDAVFTDTDRLDGAGGSVDLLVVRGGAEA